MATFYVETWRPAYPEKGVKVRAIVESQYSVDILNPTMTSVWKVEGCKKISDALALVIEKAAGKNVTVTRIF